MTTAASPAPAGALTAGAAEVVWTPAAAGDPPVAVEAGTLLATAPAGAGRLAGAATWSRWGRGPRSGAAVGASAGRLHARELAGRTGAPLRIEMRDARGGDDLVRADVVHPGVEIVVGREVVRIDRRRHDLRAGVEAGRAVVVAG